MCGNYREILKAKDEGDVKFGIEMIRMRYFLGPISNVDRMMLVCIQNFLLGYTNRGHASLILEKFESELYDRLH